MQHRTQQCTANMMHDTPSWLTSRVLCLPGHGSLQNSSSPVSRFAFASDRHGHGVPAHEQPAPGRADVFAGILPAACSLV